MIFLAWPAMLMLLIPVIFVEGLLCKRWLGLGTWQAIKSNVISNLASTIVGVPVAWAIMLAVEFGTFGVIGLVDKNNALQDSNSPLVNVIFFLLSSAWLGPTEKRWVVPAATLVLLIPFFFASYWIEYFIVRRMVGVPNGEPPSLAYPRVRIAVRNANLVSYGAMFLAASVWLSMSLGRR